MHDKGKVITGIPTAKGVTKLINTELMRTPLLFRSYYRGHKAFNKCGNSLWNNHDCRCQSNSNRNVRVNNNMKLYYFCKTNAFSAIIFNTSDFDNDG